MPHMASKTREALALILGLAGCGPGAVTEGSSTETTGSPTETVTDETDATDATDETDEESDEGGCPPEGCLDMGPGPDLPPPPCEGDYCVALDILFVIDNSDSMVEEQLNLAANFPLMIDALRNLLGPEGEPFELDAQIMITTTDMGHPLCTDAPPGYEPAMGAPRTTPCIERLGEFGDQPEACEQRCPVPIAPSEPFIAFNLDGSNVPGDDVEGAFACLAPQGVVGCEFESPLEAMLRAIDPAAAWNIGPRPFVRDGAGLAVVLITDEADCSVRTPEGYAYFTDPNFDTYWEVNPQTMTKTHATSAVCWNAGVDCGQADQNGVYPDCTSIDTGVLHPIDRYASYIEDLLIATQNKEVRFLAALGVPLVTMHNDMPPFNPIAGGVDDLVYRQWIDFPYPNGDLLPGDGGDAASKQFEFGIGPGCTGADNMGGFTGQATPPVRIREVCEGLDAVDEVRCCIESICDTDFSNLMNCLSPTFLGGFPW